MMEFHRQADLEMNPKRVSWESAVYEKGTYQKLGEGGTLLPEKYDYQYCKSKMHKFLKDAPKKNTMTHLRQFDKEFNELYKHHYATKTILKNSQSAKPKENNIKPLVINERILTTWLPLSELDYDLFNPEANLGDEHLNNYLDYLDCKDYLTGATDKIKTGIKIYPKEKFYSLATRGIHNSKTLANILQDSDSLIRADINEQRVKLEYYSIKYNAYIEAYIKLRPPYES